MSPGLSSDGRGCAASTVLDCTAETVLTISPSSNGASISPSSKSGSAILFRAGLARRAVLARRLTDLAARQQVWFERVSFTGRQCGWVCALIFPRKTSAGLLPGRKIQIPTRNNALRLTTPCEAQRERPSARSLGHGAAAFRMGCGASTPAAGADPIQEKLAGKDCIAHGVPLQPGEGHVQAAKLSTMSSHQVPCIVAGEAPPAPQTAQAAPAPKATPAPVPTTATEPAAPAAVAKASSFDFEKGTFIFG